MFRILESQAPPKQNASDTITTLSGRLQSATLVEDRRAAILGLRSFAKLYPASVASGALRSLISSLSKDGEDVDTAKIILETLLMLFNPDQSSPEASEFIALWLADEFTQRQENITALLELLDRPDFFSRLYPLQLISAISTARPERTQECVYTAPLGVSRLVAVLDDKREAIRTVLTPSSPDLQKLVAFENAFDRIFNIIDAEGSLTHGGVIVQDCLSLLANLLRLNGSNQSFFRETGGMTKIAKILGQVLQDEGSPDDLVEWIANQRDKNVWGLLSALKTCADLIRGNSAIQEQFAGYEVTLKSPAPQVNGHSGKLDLPKSNIIQALLDLSLSTSSTSVIDVRLAACECLKAYLYQHGPIRVHFLQRAKGGYLSDDVEDDNILTILLQGEQGTQLADPYRRWISAVLLFHLLHDDYAAKSIAQEIAEGDAEVGEEMVTCIQSLSGSMISGIQSGADDKVSVGYLMVLSSWLYESPDAVNDFLGEGSNVQSLVQIVLRSSVQAALVSGLCALLLGIVYEFSTKDSPIPRKKLHEILTNHLGREQYVDKLKRLREHPLIRDFEVSPNTLDQDSALREAYFDQTFVEFLKDNFSRVLRAIDRDPGIEVEVIANGVQKGVSRELVDQLKAQVEDRTKALQKAESEIITLERKLSQEQADHRKAKESASIELNRIRSINESLQRNHEEEGHNLQETHRRSMHEAQKKHDRLLEESRAETRKKRAENEELIESIQTRHNAEIKDLQDTFQKLEASLEKSSKDHLQDLQTAHEEYSTTLMTLTALLERAEEKNKIAEEQSMKAKKALEEKEQALQAVQTELDEMLIVMEDSEEKRESYKKRLKLLGESVSDDEEDGNGEDEDGED